MKETFDSDRHFFPIVNEYEREVKIISFKVGLLGFVEKIPYIYICIVV
jgi:hypothetical protein